MTALTYRIIRSARVLGWALLAWVLICLGPQYVIKLSPGWGVDARGTLVGSAAFIAAGAFLFVNELGECFPLASRWVRLVGVSLPWIGLAGVVIGGSV